MVEHQLIQITEDEAALYDRQIRLWGLEAQKKLRGSRVLLSGLYGLGAEVAKNIVLAGVKSITLMDHLDVTEEDRCAQFLVSRDDLGKNRAQSSQARTQRLNPMVEVKVNTKDITTQPKEFFYDFDVVCALGLGREEAVKINNICRAKNIPFFAGEVFGFFGYMFLDLVHQEYVEELPVSKIKTEKSEAKKQKLDDERKTVKRDVTYVPLEAALSVDWSLEQNAKRLKKLSSGYFILQVLYEFIKLHGRKPSLQNKEADVATLITLKNSYLADMQVPPTKVDDKFAAMCFGELSPFAAIIGGIIAQEIIKTVTHKDEPIKNFFFCCDIDEFGIIENFGE